MTARRRARAHAATTRKDAATAFRAWLDGRAKASQAAARAARETRELAKVDRRPQAVQAVDGLGAPVLVGEVFTSNRAMMRSLVGGKSRRVRRVTASSSVHAAKVPASVSTHVRVRLVEPSGEVTDFGRMPNLDAATLLAAAGVR